MAADELWVTAFGFHGTAMLPAILEEMRPSGGEIRQHRLGSGPWVHLRYADWRQQQQALAKNGKVGATLRYVLPPQRALAACTCTRLWVSD